MNQLTRYTKKDLTVVEVFDKSQTELDDEIDKAVITMEDWQMLDKKKKV